ncbi:protein arginine methyltransferase NDUFAF7, mitochondrial isoform X4 [Octopus bimaculoides]|uniref:protein arginine methyltransferase NDUFAF7, mitochondrial isoform X4 n=1 Tax=Octopus bimaculoides TaxID=37653 RepID=UPI00071D9273|nr:protein arginine methyltransferase NDUFAF7, mitochondrial isoform X4 [Octopus bimaculoides]|eukprot:XP_014784106.1 PREDICTED: NADH dehydrogenase [ubiquinone] complex I, assembly factor 7-like isoform X2 [Octopus bimaculoides]
MYRLRSTWPKARHRNEGQCYERISAIKRENMIRNCLMSFDNIIQRHFLGIKDLFKAPHMSLLRVSRASKILPFSYRCLSTTETSKDLSNYLKAKISLSGPITVADYMRTVLTHPTSGYYMHKDVFGVAGDFITSPEISQIFGELLGVWCVNEWMQCGKPSKMQVVELGPGRGTLAYDLLRKTERGWREVLVDLNLDLSSPNDFKFTVSKSPTPASVCFQVDENDNRDHIEMSFESGAIIETLSHRIAENGGFALIADYGHNGEKMDTLRGFFKHQVQSDVFLNPGFADLTADVDFKYISKVASNYVDIFGPTTQGSFLQNMGIGVRLKVLLQNVKSELHKDLISGCKMLIDPEQMGERYKFMSFLQKTEKDYTPAGFYSLGN